MEKIKFSLEQASALDNMVYDAKYDVSVMLMYNSNIDRGQKRAYEKELDFVLAPILELSSKGFVGGIEASEAKILYDEFMNRAMNSSFCMGTDKKQLLETSEFLENVLKGIA